MSNCQVYPPGLQKSGTYFEGVLPQIGRGTCDGHTSPIVRHGRRDELDRSCSRVLYVHMQYVRSRNVTWLSDQIV